MGVTEIARALGISKQYVDKLLDSALLKIRVKLQAQERATERIWKP
jgi:DNA-directed RNA polymerase specialized sigma subunit